MTFGIETRISDDDDRIQVIIISIKHVPVRKSNDGTLNMKLYYSNIGNKINETFKPSRSDRYVFILSSGSLMISNSETKTVDVTLIHTWQQEINKSQLKNRVIMFKLN